MGVIQDDGVVGSHIGTIPKHSLLIIGKVNDNLFGGYSDSI